MSDLSTQIERFSRRVVERIAAATSFDEIDQAIAAHAVVNLGTEFGGDTDEQSFRIGNAARARFNEIAELFEASRGVTR